MNSSLPTALEARGAAGARLSSPSAARNRDVIAQALAGLLPDGARVLEIASGTGEHALACVEARPDLVWTPSDPDPHSRASIDGWAVEAGGAIRPALDLDVTQEGWQSGLIADAVFCANMIHIAPWAAAEGLFAGASAILQPGAMLHLYGPFLEGEATAPSNLEFDVSLRARHPGWGVRALAAVDALAGRCGFARVSRQELPANNRLVSYQWSAT
ncbi:class I SAM-dependent methyltransferase [Hyphomonadaceae bacterium ML37]|nr:class I SAM-dependent methyltransferase [Hyphomonadaceae bacterium ML37]